MTYKTLTATLAGRGALVAALAVLALAAVSVASLVYAQDPPPAPTGLSASASSGGITLSWTAPDADGVTGYQILRRLSSDGWVWSEAVYVDDTGSTATSYTDSDVEAGEEYHYRVKARYGSEIGRWSNGVNVRAAGDAPPPTPDPTPEPSLSDDAALSSLELSGISFAFDPATYTYDVEVGYGIEQTVITAQTNHAGASYQVAIVWAEEYEDGVVTLAVDANTIVLAVTAEDGETTAAYTVTVTRDEEPEVVFVPPLPPSNARVSGRQTSCDALWCATLTVGYIDASGTDTYGWNHLANYPNSALTDTEFDYEGDTYGVSHIRVLGSPGTSLELFIDSMDDDIETQAIRDKLSLHVDNDAFNLGGGTHNVVQDKITWSSSVPTWATGNTVALKMYATPEFKRATADGATMTVTFTTQLDGASEPAGSAFTVNAAGSAVSVTNVDVSGETVTLTLAQPVTSGQAVTLAYAKPSSGPLQNPAGTAAPNFFSGERVFNHTLSAPCDALWCAVLTVGFYDDGLFQYLGWIDTYGDLSDKKFTYDGQTYEIGEVYTATPGDFLWLDFIDTQHGDIDNAATREQLNLYVNDVAFHIGASGTYRDVPKGISWTRHGLSWSNGAIVELRIDDRPLLESPVVDGDTMTLTFDLPLDGASEPAGSAFTVNADSSLVSVTNVDVSDKTVTLTLAEAVTFGQTVTVSYTKPAANPLQGRGGRDVTAFTDQDVTIACPIWCATLTVDEQAISGQTHFGWSSGPEFAQASLTDEVFNFAGNEYHIDGISFRDDNNLLSLSFSTLHPGDIDSQGTRIRLAVDIEGAVLNLGEGTFTSGSKTISWTHDVAWSDGQTIQLKIVEVLGPVLSISRSASPIKEARNAKATFTVTRSHLTSGYTTANLGWSRTGDYLDCSRGCKPHHDGVDNDQVPHSPVFAPGETTKTITFNIHDDNEYEQPGSITLFLRQPTIPGNEYDVNPARQSATVEVHSHGYSGGPLGLFGDRYPPILAHIEVPPVPESDGQYRVYVHARMVPKVRVGRSTYTGQITEDIPLVPSFSFTISTRQQTAEPFDKLAPNDPYDYGALSTGVLFQSRECSPPDVVNDCWRWDGQTWRNTRAVDVTPAITSNNRPAIVSDDIWENHEYFDIKIERSPGLYITIRFEEGVPQQLPLWIMDTGPAGDPGLTADWTPTGVDLAWDAPNPPAGAEWQFTVWRRNLSDSQSAPYKRVAGSIGVEATTDSTPEVNGIGDLNLVEYVVEGIAYAGDTKVALWASPKRLFRPHAVLDAARNTDADSRAGVVAPGHPTGLSAEVDTQNRVTLAWGAPAQGPVTGYKICRTDVANAADPTNDVCENEIIVSGGDTLTHAYLPNVVTLHEYRVIAVNARGNLTVEGGTSNAVRVNRRVSTDIPSSPVVTGMSSRQDAGGSYIVTLNWGSVPDATGYVVRRWLYSEAHGPIRGYDEQGRPQQGSQKQYTVSGGNTLSYTDDEDLEAGEHYQYRVYATNAAGTGNPSPYERIRLSDPDPNESWLTAGSTALPNHVDLEWNVPASAGSYDFFQVWRRALKGSDNKWKMLVADTGSLTAPYSYEDYDVDAGAEYEYRIFAANGTRHWTSPAASAEIIRD